MAIVQTYHTFEKHIRHMLPVNHKSRIRNLAWMMTGIFLLAATATFADREPLEVVDNVDLDRYLGTWYEIASYPAWFQKGCTGSTAEYSLLPDGRILYTRWEYVDRDVKWRQSLHAL